MAAHRGGHANPPGSPPARPHAGRAWPEGGGAANCQLATRTTRTACRKDSRPPDPRRPSAPPRASTHARRSRASSRPQILSCRTNSGLCCAARPVLLLLAVASSARPACSRFPSARDRGRRAPPPALAPRVEEGGQQPIQRLGLVDARELGTRPRRTPDAAGAYAAGPCRWGRRRSGRSHRPAPPRAAAARSRLPRQTGRARAGRRLPERVAEERPIRQVEHARSQRRATAG